MSNTPQEQCDQYYLNNNSQQRELFYINKNKKKKTELENDQQIKSPNQLISHYLWLLVIAQSIVDTKAEEENITVQEFQPTNSKKIQLHFRDKDATTLNKVANYFGKNPHLIPNNIQLHLHHYYGNSKTEDYTQTDAETPVAFIQGTGTEQPDESTTINKEPDTEPTIRVTGEPPAKPSAYNSHVYKTGPVSYFKNPGRFGGRRDLIDGTHEIKNKLTDSDEIALSVPLTTPSLDTNKIDYLEFLGKDPHDIDIIKNRQVITKTSIVTLGIILVGLLAFAYTPLSLFATILLTTSLTLGVVGGTAAGLKEPAAKLKHLKFSIKYDNDNDNDNDNNDFEISYDSDNDDSEISYGNNDYSDIAAQLNNEEIVSTQSTHSLSLPTYGSPTASINNSDKNSNNDNSNNSGNHSNKHIGCVIL